MKKLNKKGFTLVELLAVIVILAILIAVVMTTAIPAMTDAKQKALETYGARVQAKAKEACMVKVLNTTTTECTFDNVAAVMGAANTQYELSTGIKVEIQTDGSAKVTQGEIKDSKNTTLTYSLVE